MDRDVEEEISYDDYVKLHDDFFKTGFLYLNNSDRTKIFIDASKNNIDMSKPGLHFTSFELKQNLQSHIKGCTLFNDIYFIEYAIDSIYWVVKTLYMKTNMNKDQYCYETVCDKEYVLLYCLSPLVYKPYLLHLYPTVLEKMIITKVDPFVFDHIMKSRKEYQTKKNIHYNELVMDLDSLNLTLKMLQNKILFLRSSAIRLKNSTKENKSFYINLIKLYDMFNKDALYSLYISTFGSTHSMMNEIISLYVESTILKIHDFLVESNNSNQQNIFTDDFVKNYLKFDVRSYYPWKSDYERIEFQLKPEVQELINKVSQPFKFSDDIFFKSSTCFE